MMFWILAALMTALVVGLPSNLSPFVDAGVMLGAADAGAIAGQIDALLYDREVRDRLAAGLRIAAPDLVETACTMRLSNSSVSIRSVFQISERSVTFTSAEPLHTS